jgi:two-component system, LytTR family, response regulator
MMNAILVDDEPNNLENLRILLEKYCPDLRVVATATSVNQALDVFSQHRPDLLFLDIEMPGGNGFELLDRLYGFSFEVIFVTAYDHYSLKAIKYSALDYLLKPLNIQELQTAVFKASERLKSRSLQQQVDVLFSHLNQSNRVPRIALPSVERIDFVEIAQITYCQGDSNYTHVKVWDQPALLVAKTLKEFDELLTPHRFFRTHQSWLVNLDEVVSFIRSDGGCALMRDGIKIPVSMPRKKAFLQCL